MPALRFALCALAILAGAGPAHAGLLLETAAYRGTGTGDYVVQDGRFIGADFVVASLTEVTGVGAGIGRFGSGTVFAAIVPVGAGGLPAVVPSRLDTVALASTTIAVPGAPADVSVPLSVLLAPGDYAVVFGANLFGASAAGAGPLADGNATIGMPGFFQSIFDDRFSSADLAGVRITVSGFAVPEPVTAALLLAPAAALGARRGRRAA